MFLEDAHLCPCLRYLYIMTEEHGSDTYMSVVGFSGGRAMACCAKDLGSTPAYIYIFLCLSKP
jgi:hypothetical protein